VNVCALNRLPAVTRFQNIRPADLAREPEARDFETLDGRSTFGDLIAPRMSKVYAR